MALDDEATKDVVAVKVEPSDVEVDVTSLQPPQHGLKRQMVQRMLCAPDKSLFITYSQQSGYVF